MSRLEMVDLGGAIVTSMRGRSRWLVVSMLLLLTGCAAEPLKERSELRIDSPISAYGTWEGGTFRTGAADATFVGTLRAQLYMQTGDGPNIFGPISFGLLPFGWMVCPAIVKIDGSGAQSGIGSCTITTPDDGQIFANIACTSQRPGECQGAFKVTGGTERFKQVSGSGPLLIKPASRDITLTGVDSGANPPSVQDCAVGAPPNARGGFTRASAAGQGKRASGPGCRLYRLPFAFPELAIKPRPLSTKE